MPFHFPNGIPPLHEFTQGEALKFFQRIYKGTRPRTRKRLHAVFGLANSHWKLESGDGKHTEEMWKWMKEWRAEIGEDVCYGEDFDNFWSAKITAYQRTEILF